MSAIPTCLELVPIDDQARDGTYCLVFAGEEFFLARWRDGAWRFGDAAPLPYEPEAYQLRDTPEPLHA